MATSLAAADCQSRHQIAGNFSFDLTGAEDGRPGTWGRQAAQYNQLAFVDIPAGKVVRITNIIGDLTARWTTRGGRRSWPGYGYYTGVLAAVTTLPRSQGSRHVDWGADDTLVYVQGDIGFQGVVRVPIEVEFGLDVENALAPAGVLWFKAAKFLDETRLDTHMEITYAVTFCYVDDPALAAQ
jgi:hypothetical protein